MTTVDHTGRIVVGVDGSGQAGVAAQWAARRASELGLGLTLVLAMPPLTVPTSRSGMLRHDASEFAQRASSAARERLDQVADEIAASHPGLDVIAQFVEDSEPAVALVEATRTAELVVVGTRGLGTIKAMALGAVSRHVVSHAHGPVVVVPETGMARDEKAVGTVAVGVADHDHSVETLRVAIEEAKRLEGRLLAVHSWEYTPTAVEGIPLMDSSLFQDVQETCEQDLHALVRETVGDEAGFEVEVRVALGHAGQVLSDVSHEAELVVVGSRARNGLAGLLLGSTAAHVARTSICPVLVVPTRH